MNQSSWWHKQIYITFMIYLIYFYLFLPEESYGIPKSCELFTNKNLSLVLLVPRAVGRRTTAYPILGPQLWNAVEINFRTFWSVQMDSEINVFFGLFVGRLAYSY